MSDAREAKTRAEETVDRRRDFSARGFEQKALNRKDNEFYNSSATNTASGMPTPPNDALYAYKWMRVSIAGEYDGGNVAKHLQAGPGELLWEIVPPGDCPSMARLALNSRHKELNCQVIQLTDSVLVRTSHEKRAKYVVAKRMESKDALTSRRKEATDKYKHHRFAQYGNISVDSDVIEQVDQPLAQKRDVEFD